MRISGEAVCNTAAMREALEDTYDMLEKLQLYTPHINDVSLMRAFRGRICRSKKIVDAALSMPARNCDVHLTQPELSRAYEEYRKAAMKRYGNGLTGRFPTVKQRPMTYDEWLIAPAEKPIGEVK